MDGSALGSYPVAMFGAGVTGSLGCTHYQNIHLSEYVCVHNKHNSHFATETGCTSKHRSYRLIT